MENLAEFAECQPNTNVFIIKQLQGPIPGEALAGQRLVALVQVVH